MSHKLVRYQKIDSTGEVLGGFAAQPAGVCFHGFYFSNSAGAVGSVALWVPTARAGSGNDQKTVPGNGAGNAQIATIQIPANQSKEFYADAGIYFQDGVFLIAAAATVTGFAIWS